MSSGGNVKSCRGRWWIPVLIAVVVLVIGVVGWLILRPEEEPEAPARIPTAIASASCSKGGKHDIQIVTTQAGCTQRGCTTGTCKKCGYTYMSDMVNALGHQWGEQITLQQLSCTQDGLRSQTCSRCGLTREVPQTHTGHSYEQTAFQENTVEYVCTVCGDKITLNQGEQPPRELKDKAYLPECSEDFTFLVSCDRGEGYLLKNLKIIGKNGAVSYQATAEGDGLYRIAAAQSYEQYETYAVELGEGMIASEYDAKSLEFRILGPDRAEVEFNEDNLVFLKALELAEYGTTGEYDLQWDEAAQLYYLTLRRLNKLDAGMVGKVLAMGDYSNVQELLADSSRELRFAKLETITHNEQGQLLLVLSQPELSEVYDKLDIYFSGNGDGLQLEGDPEQAFLTAALNSEGFAEYVAAVHLAADSFAQDHGLEVTPLAQTSKDNLKFNLTEHSLKLMEDDDNVCELKLGGEITYTIPLKSKGGHASGSITMKCSADILSYILIGGSFEDEKSVDLHLSNVAQTTLTFEMEFKLDYSQSYEETYLVHQTTKKIHTSTCRIPNKQTDVANLDVLTAQQLSDRYNGNKELMAKDECKVCKAVTGLDGSAYAYNKETGVLHCMDCTYLSNTKDCNIYTLHPANTINYENCKHCRPQDRQVKDFDNRMLNAMKGSDWAQQVMDLRDRLGDSIGEKKPSQTDPNLTLPLNVMGVFNVEIGVTPVFEFDMKASVRFTITAKAVNTYGIRSAEKGYEPYETRGYSEVTYDLYFAGEADAKFGIDLVVRAYPVGCQEFAVINIRGHIGVYGHFSGVFSVKGTLGGDTDAYCAARLEVGLYVSIDGDWKVLWYDGKFTILSEQRIPLYKWGYDRMYYTFEQEKVEVTVEDGSQFVWIDLSMQAKAKYLNLKTMKEETGTIWLGNKGQLIAAVDIKNEDGSPCDFLEFMDQNGMIYKKNNAPESFSVVITVQVESAFPIRNVDDFIASETLNARYGYEMDPLVIKLKVGGSSPKRLTQVNVKDDNGNLTELYTFHYTGDLLTRIDSQIFGQYGGLYKTVLTYDNEGRLTSRLTGDASIPDHAGLYEYINGETYTYNSAGQLVSSVLWDYVETETIYEYDSNGRLIREVSGGDDGTGYVIEYRYDSAGVLISATETATEFGESWSGTNTYTYDSEGRLSAELFKGWYMDTYISYSYEYAPFVTKETKYSNTDFSSTRLDLRDEYGFSLYYFDMTAPMLYTDDSGCLIRAVAQTYLEGTATYEFIYDGKNP